MWSYLSYLGILRWADFVEIALFTAIIFQFCCWLRRDRTNFLLGYFYAAGAVFLCALFFDLRAILELYRTSWPILVLLFIIVHQKSLQQNYVAARTIAPIKSTADMQWIHLCMRAAFKAVQRKKNIIFIIQGKQQLEEHITDTIALHSPITQQTLDMIIESSIIEDHTIMLLNQTGILLGFNGHWLSTEIPTIQNDTPLTEQQKHALMWTSKTDALVFFAHTESKRITLLAQGTIVQDIPNDKAELVINQYLRKQQFAAAQSEKSTRFVQKNIS